MSALNEMQEFTFVSKYARWIQEENRRETWKESVDRVRNMMHEKYAEFDIHDDIDWAYDIMFKKKVLGSQRALQYGGASALKTNSKIFNCFSRDTEFITSNGVKSFSNFKDGDNIIVLTDKGNWKNAVVRNYGKQQLNRIYIKRGLFETEVKATANHTWILKNGQRTTALKEGDQLKFGPSIYRNFVYENATPEERLYWAYGFVYGDGTCVRDKNGKQKYTMVRLCGKDIKYVSRFEELGFSSTSSHSLKGDIIVFTGKYLKTLPNPEIDNPDLIRAFVNGFLSADGTKNANFLKNGINQYQAIQQSNEESIEFIKKIFPIAGIYIVSETDKTGQETNYGIREKTSFFRIIESFGKSSNSFRVNKIEKNVASEEVWCLEVEDDHSFVFPFGLSTGNCISSHCDRLRFFQECFWLLLCGCGTGYSVQFQHIDKLPSFYTNLEGHLNKPISRFTIPDSIEGWADALGKLIESYFTDANRVEFNFSKIRAKGELLNSGVGKAPGPDGLRNALKKIDALLLKCLQNGQIKLRPIDCYDIVCHSSDAVLSGGVRRSATICLFSKNDKEMINAKTGNWFQDNPQRARSNNSVMLLKNETTFEEFESISNRTKEFGEPGFFWTDNLDILPNPCQPAWAPVLTKNGLSTIGKIKVGDEIWSQEGWTTVTDKWSTGYKQVFSYKTTFGTFYGTENHRIVSNGQKIEAKDATTIDLLRGHDYSIDIKNLNTQDIMDGLVFGDGYIHKASNNLKLLCIGQNDSDYFDSEIHQHIKKERLGISKYSWEIETNLSTNTLVKTFQRKIPKEYIYCNPTKTIGFLRGLYSANGSICDRRVTLKATSFNVIKNVQLMLSSIGIASYYTTNKSKTIEFKNNKSYKCKQSYDLNISVDIDKFSRLIGFIQKYKQEKLENILKNKKKVNNEIISKNIIEVKEVSFEEVFDITVNNSSHTYWTGGLNVSNCVEIGLYPKDENGNSGWEACNLSTINCGNLKDKEDFFERCKAAAIIGTLQAGFTKFDYLGEISENICKKEALLGVSMTGMMENTEIVLDPEIQKEGAKIVKETNAIIADKIHINHSARSTALKPEGNSSCLLGTSSGLHPHHAKRYIRNVQVNKEEGPYQKFKEINPQCCEESAWSANLTDDIISFPIEVKDGAKLKNQISALEFLEIIKSTQINWVMEGKRKELCSIPEIEHNVSNTVRVENTEWENVIKFIYDNRKYFAGVSLLPASGDKDYVQAPFTEVLTSHEIVRKYGNAAIWCSGLIELAIQAFSNGIKSESVALWLACDAITDSEFDIDIIKSSKKIDSKTMFQNSLKLKFCEKARKFAKNYFDNDYKLLTYCIKDVFLWKRYCDLINSFNTVDYTSLTELEDNTSFEQESACAGGQCELIRI